MEASRGLHDTGEAKLPRLSQSTRKPDKYYPFVFSLLLQIGLFLIILVLISSDINKSPGLRRFIWLFSGGIGLALIVHLRQCARLDRLSAPIVYAIVFWVFHFGLVFPAAIAPALLDGYPMWAVGWLDTPEAQTAVLLSLLFLGCFVFGVSLVQRRIPSHKTVLVEPFRAHELVRMGWVCTVVGLAMVAVALGRWGFGVFQQSYDVFFTIHNDFSEPIYVIAFGLMLQAAGGRPIHDILITAGFCYLPIAASTALAGARTASLFSAVSLGVVLAKRGLRISPLKLLIAVVCVLTLISVVRETRQVGFSQALQLDAIQGAFNPIGGLLELGGSLRPVYAVVHSIRVRSEDYLYGASYLYPFYRQFQRFVGMERGTVYTDRRFVAMYINLRYGSIGFSTVAEAFFNGGVLGVIVFALVWGVILGILDRRANSPYGLAILSVVMIPMMVNIRNSFIYVPAWIFMGMVVVGICRLFVAKKK